MRKHYTGGTISQTTVNADVDLQNSYENDFDGVTFSGTIVNCNFSRCRFRSNCVFTGVTFQDCNMQELSPDGSGVDPSANGATFINCPTGGRPRGLNDGTPLKRYDAITVTLATTIRSDWDTAVAGTPGSTDPPHTPIDTYAI